MTARERLTFANLDDIAFAAEEGLLGRIPLDLQLSVATLGPIIEFWQLSATGILPPVFETPWINADKAKAFLDALYTGEQQWVCPKTKRCGFFATLDQIASYETPWIGFGLAAQKAAVSAGFEKKTAHQFVGALAELYDNIYEHSGSAGSGIIAFRAEPGLFEFAVADIGIGILSSLKQATDLADLSDHGEALRLALTDGVSRFGKRCGRGYGFRPIFLGLANLSGLLRFRSGDHALIIDGRNPTLMAAKTVQKVPMLGFVATIVSRRD